MSHGELTIARLKGLKPRECKLFARMELTEEIFLKLERANYKLSPRGGLARRSFETCVWRVICDSRTVPFVGMVSQKTSNKAVCFACELKGRVYLSSRQIHGSGKVTPGTAWHCLQPYGRGNPETLERKFVEWVKEAQAFDVTDYVSMIIEWDEELSFLETIKQSKDRDAALLIFADWLEERGDARSEKIRSFFL